MNHYLKCEYYLFRFLFWAGESHYVTLAIIELTIQTRVALISQRCACLCSPNAGIKSLHQYIQHYLLYFHKMLIMSGINVSNIMKGHT